MPFIYYRDQRPVNINIVYSISKFMDDSFAQQFKIGFYISGASKPDIVWGFEDSEECKMVHSYLKKEYMKNIEPEVK